MAEAVRQPDPLAVENSLDLILVLLYAPGADGQPGEPINGITRLQKLVFLLNQGEGPETIVAAAKEFQYQAFKMGPFTKQLYQDLDVLTSLGLVHRSKLEYLIIDDRDSNNNDLDSDELSDVELRGGKRVVKSTSYRLTPKGLEVGSDLFAGLKRRDREGLEKFKKFFNSIPLRQLLIFVYQRYPDFTTESEIREQFGL